MFIRNAVASLVIVLSALTLQSLAVPLTHKSPKNGQAHNIRQGPSKFAITSSKYHFFEWFPDNENADFYVEWHQRNITDGPMVTIRRWPTGEVLYRFHQYAVQMEGVMPWVEPVEATANTEPRVGVILILSGTTNGKVWVIIGKQYSGKFSIVFDAGSMRTGFQCMPEFVDMDQNTYPVYSDEEIITVDYFPPTLNLKRALQSMTAKVWKWSPARFRYVLVRHCPYTKRLEPLTFKHWR